MKTLFKFAFVAAIVAVVGYNVYKSQSVMNGMSDFALANVEALAGGEWNGQTCFWVDSNYQLCLPWGTGVACICYQ